MKKDINYIATAMSLVIGLLYNQAIEADPPATRVQNVKQEGQIDMLNEADSKAKQGAIEDFNEENKEIDQEDEDTTETSIEKQSKIVSLIKEKASEDPILIQRVKDLDQLTKNQILIEKHSLEELEIDLCSRNSVEINAFNKDNLRNISIVTLNAVINPPENNNFIMGENPIFDSIRSNEALRQDIQELVTFLTNMTSSDEDVKRAIELTENMLTVLNNSVGIANPFGLFIATINAGFKVWYSRKLAQDFLQQHEGSITKSLTDFTKNASASFGAGGGFPGVKASASVSASLSEGTTHHSLTATSKGGTAQVKLGFGPFAATLGFGFTRMLLISTVLQRIEQGSSATLPIEAKELKKLHDASKNSERLYFSLFEAGMSLTKILGVIPQYVDLRFGNFTDIAKASRIHVINKELGGSASVLTNLGVSIKAIHSTMNVYNDNNNYLDLVDESCYTSTEIPTDIISEKLNRIHMFEDYKPETKSKKRTKGYIEIADEAGNTMPVKSVEMSLSTVLREASFYIQVLQSLAFFNNCSSVFGNDKSSKVNIEFLENQKHEFEKRWSVSGREEAFKAILLTTSNLRRLATSEGIVELSKKIHSELIYLRELLRFSKNGNTKDNKGNYSKKSKLIVKKIQLGASIPGGASFSASVQKGLQPYITVSVVVPGAIAGIVVKRIPEIVASLRGIQETKNNMLNENKVYIADALQAGVDILNLNLPHVGQTSTFSINFVPGVNKKPVVSHYQVTTTSGLSLAAGGNIGVASVNASVSANVGTTKFFPGTNTWWYPITKLGALGWGTGACETIYEYQIVPSLSGFAKHLVDESSNLYKQTETTILELKEKAKKNSKEIKKIDTIYSDLISSAKNSDINKFNPTVKSYLELQLNKKRN